MYQLLNGSIVDVLATLTCSIVTVSARLRASLVDSLNRGPQPRFSKSGSKSGSNGPGSPVAKPIPGLPKSPNTSIVGESLQTHQIAHLHNQQVDKTTQKCLPTQIHHPLQTATNPMKLKTLQEEKRLQYHLWKNQKNPGDSKEGSEEQKKQK